MAPFNWKFDVALSFAGEDRSVALEIAEALRRRGLNVFYDEWYQAGIWGRDLTLILPDVYAFATFCIVLVSAHYVGKAYTGLEAATIRERLLAGGDAFFLPIRLDGTKLPGVSGALGHLDYATSGAEGVAARVCERFAQDLGAQDLGSQTRPAAPTPAPRRALPEFRRTMPAEVYTIAEPDIVRGCADPELQATAAGRARLCLGLVIYLNARHKAALGTPYAAWTEGQTVFVSALPDLDEPHKTLEFELCDGGARLRLAAVWVTADPRYAAIPYQAWQPAVEGLTADRPDVPLNREVVIKLLEERGAGFGFPITPGDVAAEKLCAWLQESPPSDFLQWSCDPRLVEAVIGIWQAGYHRPSGVGVLQFNLLGRWSAAAFQGLMQALSVLLPTRYHLSTPDHGCVRVTVFLTVRTRPRSDHEEPELWAEAVQRTYAALARTVAAYRQWPIPPPQERSALPVLSENQRELFDWVKGELGDGEFTQLTDAARPESDSADWLKLRQRTSTLDPPRFPFDRIVTPSDLAAFVEEHEA